MLVRPSPAPERRVGIALRLGCGSLDEADDERGFAHLLEHLAFRGSRHFAPGSLPAFFESLGTRLGHHHDASTSFDHTRFALNLPRGEREVLDRGLLCLADFAFGLLLSAEAVASERQVVLEEMRARSDGEAHLRAALLDALMAGTPVPRRHPLGDAEALRDAGRDRIAAFYERHYRPDDAWLVVAGGFDEDLVCDLVHLHFAAWRMPSAPLLGRGLRPDPPRARAVVACEPDLGEAEAALLWLRAPLPVREPAAHRARIVERTALALAQRRLVWRTLEDAAFRHARIGLTRLMCGWESVKVLVQGDEARLPEMLADVTAELRALLGAGFDADEVALGRELALAAAREAVVTAAERAPGAVAAEIEDAEADDRTWLPADEQLALLERTLPELTPDELTRALARRVRLEVPLLFAAVPGRSAAVPEAAELLRRVAATPPRAPAAGPRSLPERLLARPPAAGGPPAEVVDDARLGTRDAWLHNGVRVRCRAMPTPSGRTFVQVALFGGRLCETAAELGLTAAAALAWLEPATRDLSSATLADYLALHRLALEVAVDEDCVRLGLAVAPERLETALELLHVLLEQPRVAPLRLDRWRQERLAQSERQRASLELTLGSEALRLLTGDDPRFRPPSAEQLAGIDAERVAGWLARLGGAPLHAAIVGDVAPEQALEDAGAWLGSLAPRPRSAAALAPLRSLAPALGPLETRLQPRPGEPRAAVLCGWRGAPWAQLPERHLLGLAETIAGERLNRELREVRGLTYSASCTNSPSRAYPAASLFSATLLCAPGRGPEAAQAARDVIERLAGAGPTAAEFAAARTEYEALSQRALASGAFWARLLAEADERDVDLARLLELPRELAAFTAADLRDALRGIVRDERRITVIADA